MGELRRICQFDSPCRNGFRPWASTAWRHSNELVSRFHSRHTVHAAYQKPFSAEEDRLTFFARRRKILQDNFELLLFFCGSWSRSGRLPLRVRVCDRCDQMWSIARSRMMKPPDRDAIKRTRGRGRDGAGLRLSCSSQLTMKTDRSSTSRVRSHSQTRPPPKLWQRNPALLYVCSRRNSTYLGSHK